MTIPHSPPGITAELRTLADCLDDKDIEVCETNAADEDGTASVYQAIAARLGGAR